MANGDIQWSGRAVRWLVWRLPKSAAKYTWDSNMALATDLGRRWATLIVYGAFLWGLRWVAKYLIPPLWDWPIAVLILIWFYWAVSLARWSWNARPGAARNRQAMREMYQTVHELRTDVREAVTNAANRGGQTFTMLGSSRHHDPTGGEAHRINVEQQQYARDIVGDDQQNIPLGDRFEPAFRLPRFRRRRRGDQ